MKPNASILLVIGVASLATAVGVTSAHMQSAPSRSKELTTPTAAPTTVAVPSIPTEASPPAAIAPAAPESPVAQATPTSSGVARNTETCTVRMAVVNDPNPPLNVRSTPADSGNTIVGQLKNGTYVTVTQEQDGWLRITTPTKGWVAKNRTETGCNEKVERIAINGNTESVNISDRFIGTGNHRYLINASKGQTVVVTRKQGPLPNVIAPNGTYLLEGMHNEKLNQWSGELAETGDFVFELDSNFRGYKYTFVVEVR